MKKAANLPTSNQLYRSTANRMIGGVAGGLGEYLNIDPTIIRIGFILLTLLNGVGAIIYLVMWLLIPTKSQIDKEPNSRVQSNLEEIKDRAKSFTHTLGLNKSSKENSRFWWAVLIISAGFFFLFKNFGVFDNLDLGRFWPIILIIAGLIFLIKK
jgi:phage shock protein PspC (stress-responsive transcriptional regulator)